MNMIPTHMKTGAAAGVDLVSVSGYVTCEFHWMKHRYKLSCLFEMKEAFDRIKVKVGSF